MAPKRRQAFLKAALLIALLAQIALPARQGRAQEMAEASPSLSSNEASHAGQSEGSERSSDGFFSEADFVNKTEVDKQGQAKAPETKEPKVAIKVFVNTPHNKSAINQLTAYPYPTMPPRAVMPKLMPFKRGKELQQRLLGSGYTTKQSASIERAYPNGGWRWNYCYQAAVRHSNMGVPHIMTEMYRWADDMVPFIVPEILQSNQAEIDRYKRYQATLKEYEENHQDFESEAMHKGYHPEDVRMYKVNGHEVRVGMVHLPKGHWWMVGTHKVPGLTYYWQLPFDVEAGTPQQIELTEINALVIKGGW